MSLRLLKVHAPATDAEAVREILERLTPIDAWQDDLPDRFELQLLLHAADAEAAMSAFENNLPSTGIRLILSPVEATTPRAKEEQTTNRLGRDELLEDAAGQARLHTPFLVLAALSSLVAAVGLMRDSTALVIGAMVLAPLLGPNIALALATTLGDLKLARRAFLTGTAGLMVAAAVSVLIGFTADVDLGAREIASRTQVDAWDVAVALASGIAAALTLTGSIPGAVVGVAVAVALVPPLVVAGLLLGAGQAADAIRALLLLSVNLVSVNLAAMTTLLVQGIRPGTWLEAERARRAKWIAGIVWGGLLVVLAGIILIGDRVGI